MIYFAYSPFFSFTIERYSLSVAYSKQSCHTYQALIKYPLRVTLSFLHSSPSHPLLLFFFISTSSFPLPLHPDCMCMNIDVNYSSSQNRCSICDFPAEFAHNIPTHTHTHTGRRRISWRRTFVVLHNRSLNQASGLCGIASFHPLEFFHQKAISQYNRSSMPVWGVT